MGSGDWGRGLGRGIGAGGWGRGLGSGLGSGSGEGVEQRLWPTWKCGLPMHLAICLKRGAMIFSNSLACRASGAWCVVRGARCVVRGAWCVVCGIHSSYTHERVPG